MLHRADSGGLVPHVLHDFLQAQPGLLGSREDLVGGQQESITPRVPQLKGKGIFDPIVVAPVNAASTGLVWKGKGDGPEGEQSNGGVLLFCWWCFGGQG